MKKAMTVQLATEFGAAWNSRNPDLIASFFVEDGVYHASVGFEHLGASFFGKEQIREGARIFFDRFPNGKFENLKVVVEGNIGTFQWDFVTNDPAGNETRTAGCDLLEFAGDKVKTKNAFRKARP
jgi:nuclear transport factor 2 (NTF2) superfamily protein